jgi:hypothetical protein
MMTHISSVLVNLLLTQRIPALLFANFQKPEHMPSELRLSQSPTTPQVYILSEAELPVVSISPFSIPYQPTLTFLAKIYGP